MDWLLVLNSSLISFREGIVLLRKPVLRYNLRSWFRAPLIFLRRNMKWDTYSTWEELEFFSESRFCSFIYIMRVNVGHACAQSQAFKDRYTKNNNVKKCEKWSTEGTEYILIGKEAVTRWRGNLTLTDNEVGGWKFSKVNNLIKFKYPKIEKEKIYVPVEELHTWVKNVILLM